MPENRRLPFPEPEKNDWSITEDEDVIESKPFGLDQLRWSKSAGRRVARRAEINRAMKDFIPLFLTFHHDVFEVEPSRLYIALEQLPLEGASDEALRSYTAFREIVVADILAAAREAIERKVYGE